MGILGCPFWTTPWSEGVRLDGPESVRGPLSGAVRPALSSWASRTQTPVCQLIRVEFSATSARCTARRPTLYRTATSAGSGPWGPLPAPVASKVAWGQPGQPADHRRLEVRGAAARPLRDRLPSTGCLIVIPGSRVDPVWDRGLATAFALLLRARAVIIRHLGGRAR